MELTSPTTGWVHSLQQEVGDTVSVGQTLCEIRTTEEDQNTIPVEDESNDFSSESVQDRGRLSVQDPEEVNTQVAQAETTAEENEKQAETLRTPAADATTSDPTSSDGTSSSDASLLENPDLAMDSGGGSKFSGEGSILPSAPDSYHPSASIDPVPERERRNVNLESTRMVVKASPAVRTLAARLGVDLNGVEGTGEGGRITKEDIHALGQASKGLGPSGATNIDREKQAEVTRVDFGRTRKVMWRAMQASATIPHFG